MDSPIQTYLQALHDEIAGIRDGRPDSNIPGIAGVDPDRFGICLATADGYVYEVGDTREDFTIQSISKPLTYGLALADLGAGAVDEKIDVEPSGDAFNELSLAEGTGRPANAMINAGAIAAASLVKGRGGSSRFERILKTYSDFAGRDLDYSARVYESERGSGYRNYAMGYLLRQFNILEQDPVPVLEDYFRQCSVLGTCRDLAMIAATLANAGANPATGKQVLELDVVERVLSVMATCGMYDDAGSWLSSVGMPAKSGVGGGIIAVLPGQVGVGIYAPPLDEHGTSVRGGAACRRLSRDLGLHFVHAARTGRSAIHASYDITAAPSGIRRNDEGAEVLRSHGHRARVIELNGDLLFAGTESVIREVSAQGPDVELVILDLRRVDETGRVAAKLFPRLRDALADAGCGLLLIDPGGVLAGSLGGGSGGGGREGEDDGDGDAPAFGTRRAAVEDGRKPADRPLRQRALPTRNGGGAGFPGPRNAGPRGGEGAGGADGAKGIRRRRRHPPRGPAVRRGLLHPLRQGGQLPPRARRRPAPDQYAQRRHDLRRTRPGQRRPAGNHRQGSGPRPGQRPDRGRHGGDRGGRPAARRRTVENADPRRLRAGGPVPA